ncbi:hypothetical protein AGMMS50268_05500 [Spirochaetia bacterium]|nr:hypothetical protein AGMMS50268_05500 [Spirochaetia bacterium]
MFNFNFGKKWFLAIILITAANFVFGQDAELISAIKRNDLADVQSALRNGANPNQFFEDGGNKKSALSFAVERGRLNIVEALLSEIRGQKADPNLTNGSIRTPLMEAAVMKRTDIIDVLIKAGANVNTPLNNGNTALHYAIAGDDFNRFSRGDLDTMENILKRGGDINQRGQNGDTPILMAVRSNNIYILNRLLVNPGVDLKIANNQGFNALTYILNAGLTSTIDQVMFNAVLNKIVDSQILDYSENKNDGKNYLVELANAGKDQIVELVCNKDDMLASRKPEALGYQNEPFLLIGIRKGWSYKIIKMLVENYPEWDRLRAGRKSATDYMKDYRRVDMYGDIFR